MSGTPVRLGVLGVLSCLVAACAVEEDTRPSPAAASGSSAATRDSFANDDLTAICTLTRTCCAPQGAAIDMAKCRTLFGSYDGFQGELNGSARFTSGNVAYDNANADACLAGIAALGCGSLSAASYRPTLQACFNTMTGTLGTGAACANSVECSSSHYCDAGVCAPLVATGQPCTSSEQCSYRGAGVGCDYFDTWTCLGALRANGEPCAAALECQSGLCNGTCTTTLSTVFDAATCPMFNGASRAIGVAAGRFHTCALMSDGTVKCWGQNSNGQLGDGTTTNQLVPVSVVGLGGTAVSITAGIFHTCVLMSDGTMRCWGRNVNGQLGDGTTTQRNTPTTVIGLGGTATAIAATSLHTCALMSDGTMRCWGRNSNGQLGDGTTTQRNTPTTVIGLGGTAASISMGTDHTFAVMSDGTVKCWGRNDSGQLGDGTTTRRTTPV